MRAGFTLIEMIIGLALGLLVLYAATAGFRAASIATATANRLSLENALMREGMHRARDEVDFWTDYDDPTDATRQELRPVYVDGSDGDQVRGQAFTPFSRIPTFARAGTLGDESSRGWNPGPDSWQPHDSRTWYRGNLAEKATRVEWNKTGTIKMPEGDLRFGRYAIFSSVASSFALGDWSCDDNAQFDKGPFTDASLTTPAPGSAPILPYGEVTIPHTWYPNQMAGLMGALGWYGAIDYMPCNTTWSYYKPYVRDGGRWGSTSLGGFPLFMVHCGGGYGAPWKYADMCFLDRSSCHGDTKGSGVNTSRGTFDVTQGSSYLVPNPNAPVPGGFGITASDYRYRTSRYAHSINVGGPSEGDFVGVLAATAQFLPVLDQRPKTWPAVDVAVARMLTFGRYTNTCRIQRVVPVSGEVVELSFTSLGTSLRGARNQRAPNGGWAEWDNAASFNPAAHPTLDSY